MHICRENTHTYKIKISLKNVQYKIFLAEYKAVNSLNVSQWLENLLSSPITK